MSLRISLEPVHTGQGWRSLTKLNGEVCAAPAGTIHKYPDLLLSVSSAEFSHRFMDGKTRNWDL